MTRRLLLHAAGPGADPLPDVAVAVRMARSAHEEMPDAIVEVVDQGPAVRQLAADGKQAGGHRRPDRQSRPVHRSVREQRAFAGMIPGALADGLVVVPAAVAGLARRQYEGAAYVRV